MTSAPRVTTMDQSQFPHAPTDWKYINLTDPDKLQSNSQRYPVLLFGGYTYTALSSGDNTLDMLIIGWDPHGNIVKQVKKSGARYIWQIAVDYDNSKVTFTGQTRHTVVATLDELDVSASVTTMDQSLFPSAPEGWKYSNLTDPDKSDSDSKKYPVLLFQGYTYTALSNNDNSRVEILVIAWDAQNKIVKQLSLPGTQYLWKITLSTYTTTVTFTGQKSRHTSTTLEVLSVLNRDIPRESTMDYSLFPPAPKGWKYVNLTDPEKQQTDRKHYPVLLYGVYTYTALSPAKDSDDSKMLILGWDARHHIVKQVTKSGARSIWKIAADYDNKKVTFTGKNSKSVEATVDELTITATVTTKDQSTFPSPPDNWKYVNLWDPDTEREIHNPKHYPVLTCGAYTYTAVTHDPVSPFLTIIGWDVDGNVIKEVELRGAYLLWQITVDSDNLNAIFTGQKRYSVVVTLHQLTVPAAIASVVTMDKSLFPSGIGGWYYTNLKDPEKDGDDPQHYPVLCFGGYTYAALSNEDKRFDMQLMVWDSDKTIVKRLILHDVRFIWKITLNTDTRTVSFIGESSRHSTTTLDVLAVLSENTPRISTVEKSLFPPAPAGWKYANLTDPNTLDDDSPHYPALIFGGRVYTALSKSDNGTSMLIIGCDFTLKNKDIVKQVEKSGARYLWRISLDSTGQSVTFTGQDGDSVTATLKELAVSFDGAIASNMDQSQFPDAPSGWKYTNLVTPDKLDDDMQHYPVLLYDGYTYTALSKADNDWEMLIIGWDSEKKIVKQVQKSGSRYLWQISLNTEDNVTIVTFTGQSNTWPTYVIATLAELKV